MVNPKRKVFKKTIKQMNDDKFDDVDLLSADLAKRVGSLAERIKTTIRLDARIIEEAKNEAKKFGGTSYQKIINDRLLEIFKIEKVDYLHNSDEMFDTLMQELRAIEARVRKLEKKRA
jgi:hydrogenase maturation factor HypE